MREKGFDKSKQLKMSNWVQNQKATNLYSNNSTFVSPSCTFSLARNIIVYTPIKGRNREKYFNHIIYTGKMPTLTGSKHVSVRFFFHKTSLFHLSRAKTTGIVRQKWTSKWLFPRRRNK